jgi:hypothetical protein
MHAMQVGTGGVHITICTDMVRPELEQLCYISNWLRLTLNG